HQSYLFFAPSHFFHPPSTTVIYSLSLHDALPIFLFLHQKEAAAIGLSKALFGKETLLPYPWTHVDPLFYAFPIAAVVFVTVSWMTRASIAPVREQIQRSFAGLGGSVSAESREAGKM